LGDAQYWKGVPRGAEKTLLERLEQIRAEKARRGQVKRAPSEHRDTEPKTKGKGEK